MRTKKINGLSVVLYDSVENMPAVRFQLFNRFMALDAGIGSGFNSLDNHYKEIEKTIKVDPEKAILMARNGRQNIAFMMQNIDLKMHSFTALVFSINGVEIRDIDLSDEGRKSMIETLSRNRIPRSYWISQLLSIKKKINDEMEVFFPSIVNNANVKEFYTKLKQKTLLQIKEITGELPAQDEAIEKIDKYLLSLFPPKVYGGSEGVEVIMVKGFEDSCQLLQQMKIEANPRKLTVLAFYRALENAKRIIEEQKSKAKIA